MVQDRVWKKDAVEPCSQVESPLLQRHMLMDYVFDIQLMEETRMHKI
jgi:hypothetical protein